ncbi:MAG: restriction endonuclease subunit S, partial [Patescibacteria group bacterium]
MTHPTKKLGEVVQLQNGFAFKSSEYSKSGFFVMRIANVQDGRIELNDPKYIDLSRSNEFRNFILNEEDILISLTGNVGRVGVVQNKHLPALLNQRVARISVKDKKRLSNEYLFHFLRSPYFFSKVVARGKGMAQQNVSTREIESIAIPLPPIAEQKRIVYGLEKQFAKIDAAIRLRQQSLAATAALLPATLHEIFEEGKQKGWEVIAFGDESYLQIIDGDRGKNYPSKHDFSTEGHCLFLNTSNVRKGEFNFSKMDFISKEKDTGLRKGKLMRGDVVLTTRGTLGNTAYYGPDISYNDIRINSGMVI